MELSNGTYRLKIKSIDGDLVQGNFFDEKGEEKEMTIPSCGEST